MNPPFHNINLPSTPVSQPQSQAHRSPASSSDDERRDDVQEKPEAEVRLISAEWHPGPNGYVYNEQCFLDVKAEYLKKTIRARILGKLWGTYNNVEYDLAQDVEGFIDTKSGIARMTIKRLWFIKEHYPAWRNNPSECCSYKIKSITHSRGENEIESPVLQMPQHNLSKIIIRLAINPHSIEAQDDSFCLFSTDAAQSYTKVLNIKDDKKCGDTYLDLEFGDIDPALSYTLAINPGNEGKTYFAFENTPYYALATA